jgi:putative ATP-binding cassette transporter
MEFFRFLQRESGPTGRRIAVVTFLGGAVAGLMITIILGAAGKATDTGESFRYLLMFIVGLGGMMTAKRYSLRHTGRLTEGIIERLRMRVSDKIRRADLLFFENTGAAPFMTLLTKEAQTISGTVSMAINASAAAVMLTVAFIYIAFLSIPAFLLTLGAIAITILAYRWSLRLAEPQLKETLEMEVTFFGLVEHLLNGFKELKVDVRKNRDLHDNYLQPLARRVTALKVDTNDRFVNTTLITHSAFYGLLAVIIFLLPQMVNCEPSVVIKISTVILFIFGPLAEVVGVIPYIAKATAAIRAIEAMEQRLDEELKHTPPVNFAQDPPLWPIREIELRDVVFAYKNEDGTPGYSVGPLNLTIPAGEMLFIMGGNGSGKSTLLKLLTGLYLPDSGAIYVNGERLVPAQYHRYRNLFSVVFTDFHLFDRLYGLTQIDDAKLQRMLHDMELDAKTSYYEGRFSTLNLSTGQRKRLSLIVALLDDKSLLVFDEWAADQDPVFRKHFYEVILAELKSQGKTIIAATHDDRYFPVADRVLKMEYGHFVPDQAAK